LRKKILQSGFFKAASLAAAPSLIMGAMPLLGYAPWGRTSLEVVVFFVVVYSVIHVLVALLVMLRLGGRSALLDLGVTEVRLLDSL